MPPSRTEVFWNDAAQRYEVRYRTVLRTDWQNEVVTPLPIDISGRRGTLTPRNATITPILREVDEDMDKFVGPEEVENRIPTFCPCEVCKQKRREPNEVGNSPVHEYSYKPRNWSLKATKNDPLGYYLGVELETDSYIVTGKQKSQDWMGRDVMRDIIKSSDLTQRQAASLKRPKNLWTPKRDSSVSGPEFVSHPATLTYWKSKESDLSSMFQMLLHAGFRSHDNDKCGMHVNISRSGFEDADHLYKFLTLLHFSPAWALRMSQRTKSSADHWSPVDGMATDMRRAIANQAFDQRNSWRHITDKYSALNIPPATQGRFEFRLPRGTLRIDRFFKNLEWTTAMIEYTRVMPVATMKPKNFMAWAIENRTTYPYLAEFITERMPKWANIRLA